MHEAYEFEEITTPKSPSLLRSKDKNPNDSSRSPLREKRSVRWQDEEAPFEVPEEEDDDTIKPKPDKKVGKKESINEIVSTDSQKDHDSSINSNNKYNSSSMEIAKTLALF